MRAALPVHLCLAVSLPFVVFGESRPEFPIPPITVLMEFENPHSEVSLNAMRLGLNDLLAPAGIAIDVQLKSDLPDNAQFADLVIFKMKGHCSITARPVPVGAVLDERGPLALAYASDGQVLHFGEVHCDRLRQSLSRILGADISVKSQCAFGRAMAMVIAHEIYHMIGNATEHTHRGVTKHSLSSEELIDGKLKLPAEAIQMLTKERSGSDLSRP